MKTTLILVGLCLIVAGILIPVIGMTAGSGFVLRFDGVFTWTRIVGVLILVIGFIQKSREKKA
jgi:hypothetical protein